MGLDGVELVMATEEEFGIAITDDESGDIGTVGDLYSLVLKKMHRISLRRCLSASVFYRIRSYMISHLGIPRNRITLDREMKDIAPEEIRHEIYLNMKHELGLRIPQLELPASLEKYLLYLTIFSPFAMVLLIAIAPGRIFSEMSAYSHHMPLYLVIASLMIPFSLYGLARRYALCFAGHCPTLRDMVKATTAINYGRAWSHRINDGEIWERIRRIVSEHLGVEPGRVTPEAHFIKDLGMD